MAARKLSFLTHDIFHQKSQTKMAGRLLISCLKKTSEVPIRSHGHLQGPPRNFKIGNREIVGHGLNGEPTYMDLEDFPMPAIRFKEITPDIQVLKDKEKGDWRKLSIEEKKSLYRASFYQTFAELNAPTGEWKSITATVLFVISLAFLMTALSRKFILPPLPASFDEENQLAQYDRMLKLNINPIYGISSRRE